jgi:cell division protein FtsB
MKKIKEKIKYILAIPYVKYIVVCLIGVVLIGFVGSNSILGHFQNKARISELKEEIDYYEGEYRRDQNQIHQLQSNSKAMEKVARERFFMKTADEDIFVLSDDQREYQENTEHHETAE